MKIWIKDIDGDYYKYVKYEACCAKMKDDDDDLPWCVHIDRKGVVEFDNSGGEYGSRFEDVKYCPFCGTKIELIKVED